MVSNCLRARHTLGTAYRPLTSPRSVVSQSRHRLGDPPASSGTFANTTSSPLLSRLKTLVFAGSAAASFYLLYVYATDTRASVHQWLVPPLLRLVYPDAEDAHHAGTTALQTLYSLDLHPRERPFSSPGSPEPLSINVLDTVLPNPIGISAGLDKDAQIPDALFALGAAVVEVGGCTPLPQAGNPRPRVFRVPALDGMVNRYGLNSRGADAMAARLRERVRLFARRMGVKERDVLDGNIRGAAGELVPPGSLLPGRLLAVQIAKNKGTDKKDVGAVTRDYVYCVNRLAPYADIIVVNVSSPNTPGLRDLQATEPLTRLLSAVVDEARRADRKTKPKVMVKVSPDEDDNTQMEGVVQAVWMSGVDGVIVGNTTKRRNGLVPVGLQLTNREQRTFMEDGGYSGPAMFDRTLDLVKRYRKLLDRRLPSDSGTDVDHQPKVIFATGGITNGQQALKVLNAGASVAMVYTGLVCGGSGTITRIKREMKAELPS
jgi:dihydroorotate dehydrogenase